MALPTRVTHFSDVLCIWAYIAQRRMTELRQEFGSQVEVDYRFVSVFGFARTRLEERWKDKGGVAAYGHHVRTVAAAFDYVQVHPDTWTRTVPTSSWPSHLLLVAIRLLEREGRVAPGSFLRTDAHVRDAFFRDARDVSRQDVLRAMAAEQGLDPEALDEVLSCGRAHAELAADLELSREQDVRVSPSLLLNEGRQHLNGNVGYRVIAANIRELLEKPEGQLSWC